MNSAISPDDEKSSTGASPIEGVKHDESSTSSKSPSPENANQEITQDYLTRLTYLEKRFGKIEDKFDKMADRSIEIVGLFSAIVALVIVNAELFKQLTFLPAVLIVGAMTASLTMFASLIHVFFNSNENKRFGKAFWISMTILILIILAGAVLYFMRINIDSTSNQLGAPSMGVASTSSDSTL